MEQQVSAITLELTAFELGQIDLLIEAGLYQDRRDFIQQAIALWHTRFVPEPAEPTFLSIKI